LENIEAIMSVSDQDEEDGEEDELLFQEPMRDIDGLVSK
jgi:hypothetical protein